MHGSIDENAVIDMASNVESDEAREERLRRRREYDGGVDLKEKRLPL